MRAFLVDERNPAAYLIFPQVLQRIYRFAERYDRSCSPDVLVANVKRNWAGRLFGEEPLMWPIAVLDGDRLVGHVLFSLEPWVGPGVVILQFEIDKGVHVPDEVRREGWAIMEQAAAAGGARYFQILAHSQGAGDRRRARLFRRLGFREIGVLMRLERQHVLRDVPAEQRAQEAGKLALAADA